MGHGMMRNRMEDALIGAIDAKKMAPELQGQGDRTEQFVADFYALIPGFKARMATPEEDKGPEIGGQQTVDVVVSRDGKYSFAVQVTGNNSKDIRMKKMQEMANRPFVRLPDTLPNEPAVPKVLVFLDPIQVKKFFDGGSVSEKTQASTELMLKIIDDHIFSFSFDLLKTKNPTEQAAVKKLIEVFTQEKKKLTH